MTSPSQATVPPPPPPSDGRRARGRWALAIGLASAPLLVLVVLAATWVAGADGTLPTTTTTEAPRVDEGVTITTLPPSETTLPADAPVAFCERVLEAVVIPEGTEVTPLLLVSTLAGLDYAALIEVAPPDLVGPLEVVRDGQDELAATLAAAGPEGRISGEDLDPDFLDALAAVGSVVVEDCGAGG